jgi:hypothetical protein
MDEKSLVIPPYDRIDPAKLEIFFDVDLDEMTILFFGRDRAHYVHPINAVLHYLLDIETDEVVGLTLSRFMAQVVSDLPGSRIFLEDATIISGEHLIPPLHQVAPASSLGGRILAALRGLRAGWHEGDDQARKRMFQALPSLC